MAPIGGESHGVELSGAWNFRDVAESIDTLRPGRLLRSSELSRLDEEGRGTLHRLGLTDVADLRSRREVKRRGPGRVGGDVAIHLLPFPDLADDATDGEGGAPHEDAFRRIMTDRVDEESVAETASRYMLGEYRRFPDLTGAREAVRQTVSLLATGQHVLAHCFAGKDRTGFVVAVALAGAGIDRDAIIADYLRSNDAVPVLRQRILEMLEQRAQVAVTPEVLTFTEARLSDEVLGVRADYLVAAFDAIDARYGSVSGFLDAAGVGAGDVTALRDHLLL